MKFTLLQTDIQWASPEENIRHADALIRTSRGSDVYVLPEMWTTGFATEPEGIAETEESSAALRWMQETAVERHCAVCGSLAVRVADGTYRNRCYFCTPDGVSYYDKHHLFTYGRENLSYTAGQERCVVEYQGFRILLITCYDLRFPLWSRYKKEHPFDVIICVANWPQSRQTAWEVLTRARAIENQCFLVGVNRIGNDPYSHYQGSSRVVSARGDIQFQCADGMEQALCGEIDLEALHTMRERFRVLDDADAFVLT